MKSFWEGGGGKPLNRSFASIEEIKKASGLEEDLFEILEPSHYSFTEQRL